MQQKGFFAIQDIYPGLEELLLMPNAMVYIWTSLSQQKNGYRKRPPQGLWITLDVELGRNYALVIS